MLDGKDLDDQSVLTDEDDDEYGEEGENDIDD